MNRIFVIGDIHGCYERLKTLLEKLHIKNNDMLIFLGDYIDRGTDSKKVVEEVINLKSQYHIITLLGNHEKMLLDILQKSLPIEMWLFNGGETTLLSYGIKKYNISSDLFPPEHIEFFKSLLPYYEMDNYIFVHAGLKPNIPLEKQSIDDLVWIRDEFIYSDCDFGKVVVFGHTPLAEPLFLKNKIGIDTGAVYGEKLTCLVLPEKEIIQI
ncbi:MAG: metallophosphoesterase [Deltaproteobacteria bacterium]|nr:metallophosphoesterase [Deltaproteobacteria bacterium]